MYNMYTAMQEEEAVCWQSPFLVARHSNKKNSLSASLGRTGLEEELALLPKELAQLIRRY
jgi:hypothetical protein